MSGQFGLLLGYCTIHCILNIWVKAHAWVKAHPQLFENFMFNVWVIAHPQLLHIAQLRAHLHVYQWKGIKDRQLRLVRILRAEDPGVNTLTTQCNRSQ